MWYVFGLEALYPVDEMFIHDDENNTANIVSALIIQKYDYETIREQFYRQGTKFFRTRVKLVKVLGKYYFKEIDPKEFFETQSTYVIHKDGIHNEKDLADFLAKEQCIRDSYDHVQYRAFFIPNYNEKESCFVFKCHHCLGDGLALIELTCNLQDKYDKSQLPQMKQFSIFEKIYIYALLPFSIIALTLKVLFMPNEYNPLKTGKPLKGVKKAALSRDIPVDAVKMASKKLNVTINDLIMTITSLSIKEFFVRKGDTKSKYINLSMPYSLRESPERTEDFEFRNNFAALMVTLDLEEDFDKCLKITKKRMDTLKRSIEPFAMYYFIQITLLLPAIIVKYATQWFTGKMTVVFSNVPGPKTPFEFTGKKATKMEFFVPGLAQLSSGISIISHVDIFKIGCSSDISNFDNPQELIDIFEANFEKYIGVKLQDEIEGKKQK